jgi:hypothetical protein
MSKITSFYDGTGKDSRNRTVKDIWSFSADELEAVHDYIQWLFPLPEASQFNDDAPLLMAEDIQGFKYDPVLRQNIKHSFELLLCFYGFEKTADGISRSGNFEVCASNWLIPQNHNFLRITRILRCMTLTGHEAESKNFLKVLEDVFHENERTISDKTFLYWQAATPSQYPHNEEGLHR